MQNLQARSAKHKNISRNWNWDMDVQRETPFRSPSLSSRIQEQEGL
jgi:hypothetical protein